MQSTRLAGVGVSGWLQTDPVTWRISQVEHSVSSRVRNEPGSHLLVWCTRLIRFYILYIILELYLAATYDGDFSFGCFSLVAYSIFSTIRYLQQVSCPKTFSKRENNHPPSQLTDICRPIDIIRRRAWLEQGCQDFYMPTYHPHKNIQDTHYLTIPQHSTFIQSKLHQSSFINNFHCRLHFPIHDPNKLIDYINQTVKNMVNERFCIYKSAWTRQKYKKVTSLWFTPSINVSLEPVGTGMNYQNLCLKWEIM